MPLETGPLGERNPRTSTPGPDVAERRVRQRGIECARAENDKLRKLDGLTPQPSSAICAEPTALDSPIGHGDTKPRRLTLESPEVLPLRDHGEPESGSCLALAICAMALIERERFAGEAIAHRTAKTAPLRVNSHVVAPPNGPGAQLRGTGRRPSPRRPRLMPEAYQTPIGTGCASCSALLGSGARS